MNSAKNNPVSNELGPGLTDEMVTEAIKASGYPLQLVIANLLIAEFSLQEEWSYYDPETHTIRTIDLVAERRLFEWFEPQPRVRPSLIFVIECKKSDLPFVFFLSETQPPIPDFPLISGLKNDSITITSDDDPSSWIFRPLRADPESC